MGVSQLQKIIGSLIKKDINKKELLQLLNSGKRIAPILYLSLIEKPNTHIVLFLEYLHTVHLINRQIGRGAKIFKKFGFNAFQLASDLTIRGMNHLRMASLSQEMYDQVITKLSLMNELSKSDGSLSERAIKVKHLENSKQDMIIFELAYFLSDSETTGDELFICYTIVGELKNQYTEGYIKYHTKTELIDLFSHNITIFGKTAKYSDNLIDINNYLMTSFKLKLNAITEQ